MGDGIFALTSSVKITDIAVVSTYARFRKEAFGVDTENERPTLHTNQQGEEVTALFINKSLNLNSQVAHFNPSAKTGYVLSGSSNDLLYLNYYLNTFYGKYKLSSGKIAGTKACPINLSSIKSINVLRNNKIEPYCIYMQMVIGSLDTFLDSKGCDNTLRSAIIASFINISDTIIQEMWLPRIFAKYEVSLTEEWIKLVDDVSSENDIDTQIHMLIKNIFNINSPILDSLNRMKTFGPQIISSALKEEIAGIKL